MPVQHGIQHLPVVISGLQLADLAGILCRCVPESDIGTGACRLYRHPVPEQCRKDRHHGKKPCHNTLKILFHFFYLHLPQKKPDKRFSRLPRYSSDEICSHFHLPHDFAQKKREDISFWLTSSRLERGSFFIYSVMPGSTGIRRSPLLPCCMFPHIR